MGKTAKQKVFSYCSRCDRAIDYGDEHITIERNILIHVPSQRQKQSLTMVDGDILFMLCTSCAKKFECETIWQLLYLVPHDN